MGKKKKLNDSNTKKHDKNFSLPDAIFVFLNGPKMSWGDNDHINTCRIFIEEDGMEKESPARYEDDKYRLRTMEKSHST